MRAAVMLRRWRDLVPLSLVTGLAAWCSRGALDVVAGPGGGVRMALLPPPIALPVMMALAFVAFAGVLSALGASRRRSALRGGAAPDHAWAGPAPTWVVAPFYASALLVLPMLPVVADLLPAARVLAGPLVPVYWAGLVGLTFVCARDWLRSGEVSDRDRVARRIPHGLWCWLAAFVLIGVASLRVTGTPFIPTGDEPHYLVIAQSLWRDGDLRIENNHQRGDYREYFDRDLAPHYLTRGRDGEIYSIHPIGLPVLIAPILALGGYRLAVFTLVAIGAAAAALAWRLAREQGGGTEGAWLAWLGVTFSVPFVFNSVSVYPEIVAALAVMVAFTTGLPGPDGPRHPAWRWWLAGLALACLPWLSTKYALMTAALAGVLLGRAWWPGGHGEAEPNRAERLRRVLAVVVPGVVAGTAWLAFFHWIWGRPSPAAPYGALLQTSPRYLVYGAPGLLFDQEYGLLFHVPVLLLGAVGWWQMLRHGGLPRRLAWEMAGVFVALLVTVGAFRLWWGDASPGRPVASGLLLWMLPIAWWVTGARDRPGARLWAWALVLSGVGLTVAAVWVQQGGLVASTRDGISRLLQWAGGTWPVWATAPAFIRQHYALALGVTAVWLATLGGLTWILWRWPGRTDPQAGSAAMAPRVFAAAGVPMAVVGATTAVGLIFGAKLPAAPTPGAGSRSVLLDAFSATALPLAVRYTPFSLGSAEDALASVRFLATPGLRTDPQPVPVLLNMRLALPAGRYRAAFTFAPLPPGEHTIALRLGRVGLPYRVEAVPSTGSSWMTTFDLPIDVNFVGFEGSRGVTEAVRRIEVTPLAVVDAGRRLRVGQVLSARRYAGGDLFAHDELSWLEDEGTWVAARRRASFTFVPGEGGVPLVRLFPGPRDNQVVIEGTGWRRELALSAGQRLDLKLPGAEPSRPLAFHVWTVHGFVPVEGDPASRDRRRLGVFLEFPGAAEGTAGARP